MVNPFDRLEAVLDRWILAGRKRSRIFERFWLAQKRYFDVDAGRLAAATAYYGFFAIFAMVVTAFIILGRVFRSNPLLVAKVQTYLALNLPQLKADQLLDGSQNISILAFVGLVIAGVSWVEHLRSSQRALWKLQEHPGNPFLRWILDFAVLIGLGILILVSIAVYSGVQELIFWLVGDFKQDPVRIALRFSTPVISGLVDLVLGSALLLGVPRIRMPLHRLAPSALLFAVGLGLLKTLGKWYITRTEHNPAYQLVAGTVGLLLFMYLFHQLLLFSAALAATDQHGRVIDLAGGKVKEDLMALAASAERAAVLVEEAAASTERAAVAIAAGPSVDAAALAGGAETADAAALAGGAEPEGGAALAGGAEPEGGAVSANGAAATAGSAAVAPGGAAGTVSVGGVAAVAPPGSDAAAGTPGGAATAARPVDGEEDRAARAVSTDSP